jgi:hypothetical protein
MDLQRDLHGELVAGHRLGEALDDRLAGDSVLEDLLLAAVVRHRPDVLERVTDRGHPAVVLREVLQVLHSLEKSHCSSPYQP